VLIPCIVGLCAHVTGHIAHPYAALCVLYTNENVLLTDVAVGTRKRFLDQDVLWDKDVCHQPGTGWRRDL